MTSDTGPDIVQSNLGTWNATDARVRPAPARHRSIERSSS